jgi:autotransporter-associated beta strand protein
MAALLLTTPASLYAQVQFWDPDGATAGRSVSGNWDTTTANWTATPDSGVNTVWTQGGDANFALAATYTVTLTQPITIASLTATGTAGGLTIVGTSVNNLTLGTTPTPFNVTNSSRTLTVSAPIAGIGFAGLSKIGNGTLTLSGDGTYGGDTTLSAGAIGLGASSTYSGGSIVSGPLGVGTLNFSAAAAIFASGATRTIHNPVVLNGGLTNTGSATLILTNNTLKINAATRNITINNSADFILGGNLIDDGSARTVNKGGTGRLILAGDNQAYLGAVAINAGTVLLGSTTALSTNGQTSVAAGATLNLNGFDNRVFRLAGAGSVILGSGNLTAGNNASSSEFSGVISGSGGYTKVGSVSQVLSGTNTFTGGITIAEGALYLPITAAANITGTTNATAAVSFAAGRGLITITGSGRIGQNKTNSLAMITNNIVLATPTAGLDPAGAGSVQFSLLGQISGSGGFLRTSQGSGIAILAASNSFSGGVELDARTVALGHKNALGTGTLTFGNPTTPPTSTIVLATTTDLSGANAITNVATVNQNFTISATNNLELSGPMTLSNTAPPTIVTTLGTGAITFSGVVDGPGGLAKDGTSTLTLKGANTYASATTVNAGTLLVNNTSGSGTGTNTVTVALGATLGGSGTVEGPVMVNAGGNLAAGSSPGNLTMLNGLDLSAGGNDVWELGAEKDNDTGTAGTHWDLLSLTGGTLALGSASTLQIQFTGSATSPTLGNPFWKTNHTWKIIALSGTAANPGSSNFGAVSGTNGIAAGAFSTAVDGGGSIILSYTTNAPPPQPVVQPTIPNAGTTNAVISWSSVGGVSYQVQYKNNLNAANWSLLGSVLAAFKLFLY